MRHHKLLHVHLFPDGWVGVHLDTVEIKMEQSLELIPRVTREWV